MNLGPVLLPLPWFESFDCLFGWIRFNSFSNSKIPEFLNRDRNHVTGDPERQLWRSQRRLQKASKWQRHRFSGQSGKTGASGELVRHILVQEVPGSYLALDSLTTYSSYFLLYRCRLNRIMTDGSQSECARGQLTGSCTRFSKIDKFYDHLTWLLWSNTDNRSKIHKFCSGKSAL